MHRQLRIRELETVECRKRGTALAEIIDPYDDTVLL
jgi:hypothetical protein